MLLVTEGTRFMLIPELLIYFEIRYSPWIFEPYLCLGVRGRLSATK